jgi:hypothetical protein
MPLNPFREALGQAGLKAFEHESSFKPEADAALARFQAVRDDLERQVRRGDLTVKVAREKAQAAATLLKQEVAARAGSYSAAPRVFLDRLVEASHARQRSREQVSLEGLQRETNRLLRLTLVEQQLQTRAREFEAKTFVRRLPGGTPAPSLDSLLSFHESATNGGDDAAVEWSRRQLEEMRPRVADPADLRRIDMACDRPDVVNPRIVATYLDSLAALEPAETETFADRAVESGDANACVAAFLLARGAEGGTAVKWVRTLLNSLGAFPDAALSTLRTIEAEARADETEAARTQAEYAAAVAEAQARFSSVEAPTADEVNRAERARARPAARLGEPIGLALERRGMHPGDEPPPAAPSGRDDDGGSY